MAHIKGNDLTFFQLKWNDGSHRRSCAIKKRVLLERMAKPLELHCPSCHSVILDSTFYNPYTSITSFIIPFWPWTFLQNFDPPSKHFVSTSKKLKQYGTSLGKNLFGNFRLFQNTEKILENQKVFETTRYNIKFYRGLEISEPR